MYMEDSPTKSEKDAKVELVRATLSPINTKAHPAIIPAATAISVPILDFGMESAKTDIDKAPVTVPVNDIRKGVTSSEDIVFIKLMNDDL